MRKNVWQAKVKIEAIKKISLGYFKLEFFSPNIAKHALPGQFLQIKISGHNEPFLRRPFSIHQVSHVSKHPGGRIGILYEIKGKGTEMLSRKLTGESLDVIGPLGNGFDYQGGEMPILVAGGMGVVPLMFLADKLAARTPLVLIGARTKNQILCEKEFKQLGCEVKIATDDGSLGLKGRVTELLENILDIRMQGYQDTSKKLMACRWRHVSVYACGPRPMLRETSRIAQEYHIPAQISLEEHMSCGIGACLGCVVKTKSGFQRVCKDGPVFDSNAIIW